MKHHDKMAVFVSKPPTWDHTNGFSLSIGPESRIKAQSIKGFQLVQHGDPTGAIKLEFGKASSDHFVLDVASPFSPFAAFAVALTSFAAPSKVLM